MDYRERILNIIEFIGLLIICWLISCGILWCLIKGFESDETKTESKGWVYMEPEPEF